MMPMNITFMNRTKILIDQRHYSFKAIEECEVSLGLNSNIEFYFQASESVKAKKSDVEKYTKNFIWKLSKISILICQFSWNVSWRDCKSILFINPLTLLQNMASFKYEECILGALKYYANWNKPMAHYYKNQIKFLIFYLKIYKK